MHGPRLAASILALGLLALSPALQAQAATDPTPVRPIDGSLVFAGAGKLHEAALKGVLHLGGGFEADVVVVATGSKPRSVSRWKKAGARSVLSMQEFSPSDVLAMLEADTVWFEDGAGALLDDPLFTALLRDVLARGGVVGGQGEGAQALCGGSNSEEAQGLSLLPRSRIHLSSKRGRTSALKDLTGGDGLVHWQLSKDAALVVHSGRRVGALGGGDVVATVLGTDDWPTRERVLNSIDAFDYGDIPGYNLDLLSWLRSAQDCQGPAFPATKAAVPVVPKGTLVLSGGGGVASPTWKRFIEAAGGKKARFVTIPSAKDFEPGQEPKSYGAGQLRDHGCKNVVVLHVADPNRADQDPLLLELLDEATGVWIDGGRTYRFMDAFQYTQAQELIRDVLKRGGAVGGSSAGCQVLGEFLVRGDPKTNRTLTLEGYTKGLGLLPGVILDAHFLQRDRHAAFAELIGQHQQLLGIGVDEDTALIIQKSVAEVIGEASVSFYDTGTSKKGPVILQQGARYDLRKRRPLR